VGANSVPPKLDQVLFAKPTPPKNDGPRIDLLPCVSHAAMASRTESRFAFSAAARSNIARRRWCRP
jgi:hypothetical protein